MPTLVRQLDHEEAESIREQLLAMYFEGECYAFATALFEGLGWPIIGLMVGTQVRHAAVRSPDGRLLDARGFVSDEKFGRPFNCRPPYQLREMSADELMRRGETSELRARSVHMARLLAEAAWPDLPWIDSATQHLIDFCDELEALCRRHRLWIRAPYPAAAPVLAAGKDDEGGYEINRTADGLSFTIDRYLRR